MIKGRGGISGKVLIILVTAGILSSCEVYEPKYATGGEKGTYSQAQLNTESKEDSSPSSGSTSNAENPVSNSEKGNSSNLSMGSASSSSNSSTPQSSSQPVDSSNTASVPASNAFSAAALTNATTTAYVSSIDRLSNEELSEIITVRQKEQREIDAANKKAKAMEWKDKIIPGITIGGIDVSGLTLHEAKAKVEEELMTPLYEKQINYSVDGVKQYLTYGEMSVALKEDVFTSAVDYGKDLGVDDFLSLLEKGVKLDLKPEFTMDEEYLKNLADKYAMRVINDSNAKNAVYEDGTVTLKSGAQEKVLDKEEFLKFVKENVNTDPESTTEKAIAIKTQKTSIKQSDLDKIDTEFTSYSTDYSWSPENRKTNVELAAKNIDNILLMPGAEFSFNRMVGPQTKAKGFKDSLVYVGNKTVLEPGGGVCQVSTTLYNSILNVGIDPTERSNHGMTISYAPLGMDATVAEPYVDFKFRNNLKHPILIKSYFDGANLTFSIYGQENDLNGYTYKYESEVTNKVASKTEIIEDPELPQGYEKIETTPYDGFEVKVWKYTYKDGKEVKKELYGEDKYSVVNEIIRRGTGDPNVKTVPVEPENTVPEVPLEEKE